MILFLVFIYGVVIAKRMSYNECIEAENCLFFNCSSSESGGGLYVSSASSFSIKSSTFTFCRSERNGAAVCTTSSVGSIVIEGNCGYRCMTTSDFSGQMLYIQSCKSITFINNAINECGYEEKGDDPVRLGYQSACSLIAKLYNSTNNMNTKKSNGESSALHVTEYNTFVLRYLSAVNNTNALYVFIIENKNPITISDVVVVRNSPLQRLFKSSKALAFKDSYIADNSVNYTNNNVQVEFTVINRFYCSNITREFTRIAEGKMNLLITLFALLLM